MQKPEETTAATQKAWDALADGLASRGALRSSMFGMPCLKTPAGKACVGLFGNAAVFKLHAPEHAEALALDGAVLFDPSGAGRPMKEWVAVAHRKHWARFGGAALEVAKAAPPAKTAKPKAVKTTKRAVSKLAQKRRRRFRDEWPIVLDVAERPALAVHGMRPRSIGVRRVVTTRHGFLVGETTHFGQRSAGHRERAHRVHIARAVLRRHHAERHATAARADGGGDEGEADLQPARDFRTTSRHAGSRGV